MTDQVLLWGGFNLFVLAILAIDLGVFHRTAHEVTLKESVGWSVAWVTLAALFNLGIYFWSGQEKALEFLAGYLIEKSLSVDNIFVFILIFSYFKVPAAYQHKVLFWGILGALVMRAIFIAVGAVLIQHFHWIIYLFGGFLVFTGIKIAVQKETGIHPERNPLVRIAKRFLPVTPDYHADNFFVTLDGRRFATPLFLVLLVIESSDLVFAVDSIPAIFAITDDPFIVYTSNVFAILGLRALYFQVAGVMSLFHYLKFGLAAVLVFVGAKMMLADVYKIPIGTALGVVAGILVFSIMASLLRQTKAGAA